MFLRVGCLRTFLAVLMVFSGVSLAAQSASWAPGSMVPLDDILESIPWLRFYHPTRRFHGVHRMPPFRRARWSAAATTSPSRRTRSAPWPTCRARRTRRGCGSRAAIRGDRQRPPLRRRHFREEKPIQSNYLNFIEHPLQTT